MTRSDPATTAGDRTETDVGSVFVSNYPPYSVWSDRGVPRVEEALAQPASADAPLGLYLHVPFCRRRCKFCYFKVYTDKNSGEIERYCNALATEVEALATRPAIAGRPVKFVYFGGGTPSYISSKHLRALVGRVRDALPLDELQEFTFECEPGTLTREKLEAIKDVGVTRLSLGVENFDDEILRENGRAHESKEIYRVAPWIREIGFDQLNVDLIAGMVGETWDAWRETVRKTIEMEPDSVTIYQMELPFNTIYSGNLMENGGAPGFADWPTKRAWHSYAIDELTRAGHEVSSAYTVVRADRGTGFLYRDSLWRGADLLGTGVASFSHVDGVHYQNLTGWEPYLQAVEEGRLPLDRALAPTRDELMTREWILQMKLGRVEAGYFRDKFGVDPIRRFDAALEQLRSEAMLDFDDDAVTLTRDGLLRVDSLLPLFYDEKHRGARYT